MPTACPIARSSRLLQQLIPGQGIEAIHIVGISPAHALLGEAEKAGSFGTAFLRG